MEQYKKQIKIEYHNKIKPYTKYECFKNTIKRSRYKRAVIKYKKVYTYNAKDQYKENYSF